MAQRLMIVEGKLDDLINTVNRYVIPVSMLGGTAVDIRLRLYSILPLLQHQAGIFSDSRPQASLSSFDAPLDRSEPRAFQPAQSHALYVQADPPSVFTVLINQAFHRTSASVGGTVSHRPIFRPCPQPTVLLLPRGEV